MPSPQEPSFFSPEKVVMVLASLEWASKSLFVVVDHQQPSDLALVIRREGQEDEILLIDRGALREFASGLVKKLGN